jgi:hypothetical protein
MIQFTIRQFMDSKTRGVVVVIVVGGIGGKLVYPFALNVNTISFRLDSGGEATAAGRPVHILAIGGGGIVACSTVTNRRVLPVAILPTALLKESVQRVVF